MRASPCSRRLVVGVVIGLAVGLGIGPGAAAADPPPVDARDAQGGQQRWDPPLAGSTVRVELRDGTARLASARDGAEDRSSLRGAGRQGFLDLGTHQFGSPVNRIEVPLAAQTPPGTSVEADVRGQAADGRWSEWAPAAPGRPAQLDEPARTVEVRLALLAPEGAAGPVVRSATVLADRVATGPRVIAPRATYRVFATREGLVGGTTANGHKITPNDQFVALPSRRSLSPDGRGDYSVRICAATGKCAVVPVWDIGPWNTTDDYWNPPALRESWKDLPQGRPQAQAAFEDKHNGGKDGFGRTVSNPAGIDVADGTFAAIGLKDNGFVTVDYLWTDGPGPIGLVVSPGAPLPVRAAPRSAAGDLGVVGDGAQVGVSCAAPGDPVAGSQGTSTMWLRLAGGPDPAPRFVPASSFRDPPPLPAC